jgi:hypothetical protein
MQRAKLSTEKNKLDTEAGKYCNRGFSNQIFGGAQL